MVPGAALAGQENGMVGGEPPPLVAAPGASNPLDAPVPCGTARESGVFPQPNSASDRVKIAALGARRRGSLWRIGNMVCRPRDATAMPPHYGTRFDRPARRSTGIH